MTRFPDSLMTKNGEAQRIFIEFAPNKQAVVLDVGCGSGSFLKSLQDHGYSCLYGMDIENAISDLTLPTDHFEHLDVSFNKSSYPDNYFDAITAWQVVEHLENPHNFIREAHRILKPGGYFFVSIPNPFHLMSKLLFLKHGDMPRWTRKNNHITILTKHLFYKAFLKDYYDLLDTRYYLGEFTYGIFKYFDGRYPENELFGHFIIWVMRKKAAGQGSESE